ncbi:sensor histidine kinase [Microbulbifer sp.]|uniref:sensor histidine kinase n=1 Tax=Microbulbifer sp. TaxID=1908541 RepID=UPI003F2DF9DD
MLNPLTPLFATTPPASGRLGDFSLRGRLGPLLAFALVCGAFYAGAGYSSPLALLIKLWVAYSIAFIALAVLAQLKGTDAPWRYLLPTAVSGIAAGGLVAAAIAYIPLRDVSPQWHELAQEWAAASAFAAFFVGLSLVTGTLRRREQLMAETRRQLLEARLRTLTAQIEPHFLMNTLANVRYLVKTDAPRAQSMLDHLADFFQGALERSRDKHSDLGQELQLVKSYLSIMQIRLGDKLQFAIDAGEELRQLSFPALLLHTLVENAVIHGIAPSKSGGLIRIAARRTEACIEVSVTDNGVGPNHSETGGQGVGLRNARERLETFYDGRATLRLTPAPQGGTLAKITIPA